MSRSHKSVSAESSPAMRAVSGRGRNGRGVRTANEELKTKSIVRPIAKPRVSEVGATLLWPTLITNTRYAGVARFNRELMALIARRDFWTHHHHGDMWRYEDEYPALGALREMFVECAMQWLRKARLPLRQIDAQRSWAYRYSSGEYLDIHDHSSTHLSSVYYVEVPPVVANPAKASERTPKEGGHLVFHDCRRGVVDTVREWAQLPSHSLRPKAGMLVTFPAHLLHQVKPFMGPGKRTIVSNNTWFRWD